MSDAKEEIVSSLSTHWEVFKLTLFYMGKGTMNGVRLQKPTSFAPWTSAKILHQEERI